ncbi:antibiotic resistance protein [Rhizobium sp. R72]|uniref:TfuA-like protein n=1 Tax=unclassified Rhizobium TaxID=2613769 RepID=UPI000B52A908|nr:MULTISPECIES: TfuA-like protein [unclassified Rhizobium]OWW04070.1 antibiotic resistance protein [Rhizobium sp. R72]OWW04273.1 antibiotic resistance protein [Rhizobium sp. R711]
MKVVFVGPSLPDAARFVGDEVTLCPPAVRGDVIAAVNAGARVIGIIDGGFEYIAPVWHKEILYALSQNVNVFGAASMGALRAAECRVFGMVGVGRIYCDYASGVTIDDSDVALLHGPAELGYKALTIPLVNVRATLDELERRQALTRELCRGLEAAAANLFFKARTWPAIVASVDAPETERQRLLSLLRASEVDQKRADALALVEAVRAANDPHPAGMTWQLNKTFIMPEKL